MGLRHFMDIRNFMVLRHFMDIRNFMVVITLIRVILNNHGYNDGEQVLISGFFILILIAILWWRDFNEGYFLKIINIRNNKR
jgi:hypothetical protein